jgi:hypothetical protein
MFSFAPSLIGSLSTKLFVLGDALHVRRTRVGLTGVEEGKDM